MKTWAKGFDSAPSAGGKTAGTFDKIGTITIPNKDVPVYLYGVLIAVARQAVTAGEPLAVEMEINSSDLGLYQERYHLKAGSTDPIATNTQFVAYETEFIPILVNQAVNNKKVDIHLSVVQTVSDNLVAYASVVFGDTPPDQVPQDYLLEVVAGFESRARSLGRIEEDAAKAHGTANSDVTLTAVSVPSKAAELVGLLGSLEPNAPTAGEELLSQFTFESGSISDFAPQEYPGCLSVDPTLGTVVGGAVLLRRRYYPVRFPLPKTNFDLVVKSRNIIALTNAPNTVQGIKFRV